MAEKGLEQLFEKQRFRDLLHAIAEGERAGAALTLAEVARALNIRASSAHHQVGQLAEKEVVCVEGEGHSRRVRLTKRGRELAGFAPVDLLARRFVPDLKQTMRRWPIPCSPLRETCEEADYVTHPFRSRKKDDYLVTAEGDSMFNPNLPNSIAEGDEILMRPDVFPENGSVVHVELLCENGAHKRTLKVFELDERNGTVTLWALNPAYLEIVLPISEVNVIGVALQRVTDIGRYSRK